jgi:hypothetical protein
VKFVPIRKNRGGAERRSARHERFVGLRFILSQCRGVMVNRWFASGRRNAVMNPILSSAV